jgi:hypothetical protein
VIARSAGVADDATPKAAARDPRRAYDRGAWSGAGEEPVEDGAPLNLSSLSTVDIVAELRRREGRVARLLRKRQQLTEELADLEREIRAIEDAPPVARVPQRSRPAPVRFALPRPSNSLSLADAIASEIEPGETVGPSDVARRVLRNGYQTAAKNFPLLVNGTLRKDARFERVGRGLYLRRPIGAVQAVAD